MEKSAILLGLIFFTIMLSGCSAKKGNSMKLLTDSEWELFSINGNRAEASSYGRGLPYASFTEDNKVRGNGGCNQFSGNYTFNSEGSLTIGQLISTKMFCEGNGEGEFMNLFSDADNAKVEQGKLRLLSGDKEVLVFVPKTK